jgi:methylmalonyl-CoA/ethylmalonyl-CoA epimerase
MPAISQIALHVSDADRAEAFYQGKLGLTRLYRFGELIFFDCGGVRLMLDGGHPPDSSGSACCIYYRVEDIVARFAEMKAKSVNFDDEPHLIARMPDHELWMVFFKDPDGNQLALMEERR